MNIILLLGSLMTLELVLLWGLLAMASWSDRRLALAWQEWSKMETGVDGALLTPARHVSQTSFPD